MRKIKDIQLELAGTAIEDIRFNLKSRDDIPAILIGLQHIYTNPETAYYERKGTLIPSEKGH